MESAKKIGIVILIIALFFIFYGTKEHMCGGSDTGCTCSGNETMVGGLINDNKLTQIAAGH